MPSSTATVFRLLEILCLVQSGGAWTSMKLADRFGVTRRVIHQDAARRRDGGLSIEHDVRRRATSASTSPAPSRPAPPTTPGTSPPALSAQRSSQSNPFPRNAL